MIINSLIIIQGFMISGLQLKKTSVSLQEVQDLKDKVEAVKLLILKLHPGNGLFVRDNNIYPFGIFMGNVNQKIQQKNKKNRRTDRIFPSGLD